MKDLLSLVTYLIVFCACFIVQAAETPNGFIIWSEGGDCDRELKFNKIENGQLGPKQTAVKKDSGVDSWVEISFDGKWIAFARSIGFFSARYGKCDCMASSKFDIYIARIDGILPAKPIKIEHGYWPSWGDDSHKATKTLYFSVYEKKAFYKSTIKPDGSFSTPVEHAEWPNKNLSGSRTTMEISPDGRYIAYSPGSAMDIWDIKENKNIGNNLGAYFPTWGPRSKYIISHYSRVCIIENGQGKKFGKTGLSGYWHSISNDAEYEDGKLWIIAQLGATRNGASPIEFREVDISGGQWNEGNSTEVGKGTSADIHIFKKSTRIKIPIYKQGTDKEPLLTTQIKKQGSEVHLVILSNGLSGYHASLYDIRGRRHVYTPLSASSKNSIPLYGVSDGRYMLIIKSGMNCIKRTILFTR